MQEALPGKAKENEKAPLIADGAIIKEVHITSNRAAGKE
jgi:hypothetical protein